MARSIVAQTHVQFKPLEFGPECPPEGALPPVEVAGQDVFYPVLTGEGTLVVVDTGSQILELGLEEVDVLREVILSWDVAMTG